MGESFNKRLQRVMKDGALDAADLHHWFERPRATVRTWVNGRSPQEWTNAGREAYRLLSLLESAVRGRRGFPIAVSLSQKQRPARIKALRNAALRPRPSLSRKSAAARGVQVRRGAERREATHEVLPVD